MSGVNMKFYIYAALVAAALAGLSTALYMSYSAGKQSVLTKLKDDRITVLQDGKRIDETVLTADDDALYCLLIDCADQPL
jgi:hypothetical protein